MQMDQFLQFYFGLIKMGDEVKEGGRVDGSRITCSAEVGAVRVSQNKIEQQTDRPGYRESNYDE